MIKKIVAIDKDSRDQFGWSVAMSGDGTKVIVGADNQDPDSLNDAGSAYIYELEPEPEPGY